MSSATPFSSPFFLLCCVLLFASQPSYILCYASSFFSSCDSSSLGCIESYLPFASIGLPPLFGLSLSPFLRFSAPFRFIYLPSRFSPSPLSLLSFSPFGSSLFALGLWFSPLGPSLSSSFPFLYSLTSLDPSLSPFGPSLSPSPLSYHPLLPSLSFLPSRSFPPCISSLSLSYLPFPSPLSPASPLALSRFPYALTVVCITGIVVIFPE